MRLSIFLGLAFLTLGGPAGAQAPYLVRDINDTIDARAGAGPDWLAPGGSTFYFLGEDDASGREIFRTDGTPAGTRLVIDLDPWDIVRPTQLTGAAGNVFFVRHRAPLTFELWWSDGTVDGTMRVAGVEPVTSGYPSLGMVSLGPLVFFRAVSGGTPALWRSDGTPAGTYVLRAGDAEELTPAGGALYFRASETGTGSELWRSDGTVGGTTLVKDICPGSCSGFPTRLAALGNEVFFAAREPATGTELWRSDGTLGGTTIVKDIVPGGSSSGLYDLTGAGATLFFSAFGQLWKSDGTPAGTVVVHPISPAGLAASGSNVFFFGQEPATGTELWTSDGTTAGTHLVADLCPGPCSVFDPGGQPTLVASGNLVYFALVIDHNQAELWRSDGTGSGTLQIRSWARLGPLAAFAADLLFAGDDGTNGVELWRTDGTDAGTVALTQRVYDSSYPGSAIAVGQTLFFTADEPSVGTELWSTAGTAATTAPLDLEPGPNTSWPRIGTAVGDRLVFAARTDPASWGVWSTDGTMAGSEHLFDASTVTLHPASTVAGLAVFGAGTAADHSEAEPWRSDGSPAGTFMIADLRAGGAGSQPNFLATRGDVLFFTAAAPCETCGGLWRTDGTSEGTRAVVSGSFWEQAMLRETLFVTRFESSTGAELWASDGTASGTRLVRDIVPGPESSLPHFPTAAGDLVYFVTGAPSPGGNLWRSDGTEAGTYQIKDFSPAPATYSNPFRLTEMNGLVYFVADDGVHGRELWRSDGTAAGTWMVKDIWPGPGSALSKDDFSPPIIAAGGRLFLAAYTPATGIEPWQSDGTEAGTSPLAEISPGPRSSAPVLMGSAAGRVYLNAHDGIHGWEPWAVDLPPALSVRDLWLPEGDAGTTAAQFEVRLSKPAGQAVTVAYATADRSAATPADYLPRSGTLTFAAGSVGPLLVSVPVLGDLQDEPVESFILDLASPAGAVLADSQGVALILDDDAPMVLVTDVAVTEGDAGTVDADFVVTIATADGTPTAAPKTVAFATEGSTATAPGDFTAVSGSLTLPAGTPSGGTAAVRVSVNGDTADEPDETFRVRLTSTSDVTLSDATAVGTILDDDGAASVPLELAHGMSIRTDLAAGPAANRDWYLLRQEPYASYEIVVDDVSGDVTPLQLRRWAADGITVLQSGAPVGSGPSVSLRWENTLPTPIGGEHVSVESGGCGTDCGADDTYRVRAYETTLAIPRLNTANGQATALVLQNRSDHVVSGHVLTWSPSGYLWYAPEAFTLEPRSVSVLQPLSGASGFAGSMTVTHDGAHGDLVGKAVSIDPATGFSFDTPAQARQR